jgi:hypothetical protein
MGTLTNGIVRDAKPRAKVYELTCAGLPGFALRVLPTGKKVFVVRHRMHGQDCRVRLGLWSATLTVEEARRRAAVLLGGGELDVPASPHEFDEDEQPPRDHRNAPATPPTSHERAPTLGTSTGATSDQPASRHRDTGTRCDKPSRKSCSGTTRSPSCPSNSRTADTRTRTGDTSTPSTPTRDTGTRTRDTGTRTRGTRTCTRDTGIRSSHPGTH